MRFLIAGVALVLLAVGLAEYDRRHPHGADATATAPSKPGLPPEVQALLETAPPSPDAPAAVGEAASLLGVPDPLAGFTPVVGGDFTARELRGGFGAVLFLLDANGRSAIVRAVSGEPARVVAARPGRVSTLQVDGSTAFFAEGGTLLSMSARGDEPPKVRVAFARAVITSLAPVGDTVFVSLRPKALAETSNASEGAVAKVDSDGAVTLVAGGQVRPRALVADGRDVFWVAGASPSLWRASADASFSSKVADDADGPLALDGDGVVLRQAGQLKRIGRVGGKAVVLAEADPGFVSASSGLVRYATGSGLYEVTAGAAPTRLLETTTSPLGVALGGTGLYVLLATAHGAALYAK